MSSMFACHSTVFHSDFIRFSKIAKTLGCALLLGSSGCSTTQTSIPEFEHTGEEILNAKAEFKNSHYEILFLLMVDRDGNVVKSRILDRDERKIKRESAERFRMATYRIEFVKAENSDPEYRQFFYPMDIDTNFEWR